jgi:hypothetical protein
MERLCNKIFQLSYKLLYCLYVMTLRGGVQHIPEWFRHLYSSCGSAKHGSQKAKLWIQGWFYCEILRRKHESLRRLCPEIWREQTWLFYHNAPSHTSVLTQTFLAKHKMAVFTHRTPLIWPPVTSSYFQNEIEAERTPVWYQWGDPGRIAGSVCHSVRKGLSGSVPKMEETMGLVSKRGRKLFRGWWRPIGLMVSFMIFTASGRNILDTLVYPHLAVHYK